MTPAVLPHHRTYGSVSGGFLAKSSEISQFYGIFWILCGRVGGLREGFAFPDPPFRVDLLHHAAFLAFFDVKIRKNGSLRSFEGTQSTIEATQSTIEGTKSTCE